MHIFQIISSVMRKNLIFVFFSIFSVYGIFRYQYKCRCAYWFLNISRYQFLNISRYRFRLLTRL